ncbi:hypothetical protein HPULCUR_011363 [Helicostylum pulchrum]|uniref:Beta-lactamase n=1 Tax=Helicostylum pulchrum TaxID=562976 RepID=A0ABP9YHT2_9FUNG
MRVVPTNTTAGKLNKQEDCILEDPIPFQQSTLGIIHKKKPLPKIPLNKLPEHCTSPNNNGYVSVGPAWTATNQFIMSNEINNQEMYYTESPTQQYNMQLSHLLLTQPHCDYYYNQPDSYYVYQHPHQYNNSDPITTSSDWKTSSSSSGNNSKNISRSDSLKIETTPVPFSKGGYLPLETHLEKPFEPTLDDLQALNRKASKEELFSSSILLQKLDQSVVQLYGDSNSSSTGSDLSSQQTSISSFSIPAPPKLLTDQRHRHSMPLLNTKEDISFASTEKYFQPTSASPISSRIPSPWGTSRSATVVRERASIGSIPNLVPEEISNAAADEVIKGNKAEQYFNEDDNRNKCTLSIASCSLINIRSNTKLYRRMAIKTRNKETQMTYARYLLQISKLYEKNLTTVPVASASSVSLPSIKKNETVESPSDTRHRLLSEAGYWIERLAKAGQPEALFIKGKWHLIGPLADDCVIPGYEKVQENKAFKCFLASSKAGWIDAHYELAHLWKKRGNNTKAIQCYEKGAKEKHTLSIYVSSKMAKILLRGQLKKKKDIPKGMAFLKQAADMEDAASAEPAFVLGCIHANEFDRIGIQRNVSTAIDDSPGKINYSLALKYLKKSAHHGYPDAIYFMGQVSEKGILGQLCDSWQAYQNYMKAAEVNHAGAMLDLSRIYSHGIPGLLAAQKDIAFKWCRRSADLGFDQAEYVLGKYYEDGIGVTPDFPLALEYFGKAASKGYQPAAEKLNRPLADGSRRSKKGPLDKKQNYLTVVISDPKVKRDDDDDDYNDELNKKHYTREQNNICTIQ